MILYIEYAIVLYFIANLIVTSWLINECKSDYFDELFVTLLLGITIGFLIWIISKLDDYYQIKNKK